MDRAPTHSSQEVFIHWSVLSSHEIEIGYYADILFVAVSFDIKYFGIADVAVDVAGFIDCG